MPSRLYTAHCVGAAQGYIKAAVQRKQGGGVQGTKEEAAVAVDVPEAETGEVYGQTWNTLEEHKLERAALSAAALAGAAALASSRRLAAEGDDTKLVVFTPSKASCSPPRATRSRLSSRPTAFRRLQRRRAWQRGRRQVVHGGALWYQQALENPDDGAALLSCSFENAAGLNLQYVCHHVVLYAPLWAQDTVAAVANEQRRSSRVRYGQTGDRPPHADAHGGTATARRSTSTSTR